MQDYNGHLNIEEKRWKPDISAFFSSENRKSIRYIGPPKPINPVFFADACKKSLEIFGGMGNFY